MGLILFGIPSAVIASVKGFKPWRWLLALGVIGLVTVLFMPSAKAGGISPEDAAMRANKANTVSAYMAWINVSIAVLVLLILLANAQ